jgi:DNA polymerase-3 subunit delta
LSAQRVAAIAREWPSEARLLLLHGYDPSGSNDHAARICKGLVAADNPAGLERLTGEQIVADPQALVAAAGALSMFGGQTIVRVDGVTDKAAKALALLLEGPPGNPVIAVAEGLRKASPLLALAREPGVLTIESKEARPGDLTPFAADFGLKIDREAAAALFEACGGERALIRRELEKIALFLDAAPETPKPLNQETLAAIGAGIEPFDQNALIASILGGHPSAAAMVATLPDGLGIMVLRLLGGRLATLLTLRLDMDQGARAEAAIDAARPPIFWKEKPVFAGALRRFSSEMLSKALADVLAAERAVKSAGSLGELEVHAVLLRLARVR